MTNPEDLIRRHRRLYTGMAFAAPHMSAREQEIALSGSLSALEAIVAACPDRPISNSELDTALSGLPKGDARLSWHVGPAEAGPRPGGPAKPARSRSAGASGCERTGRTVNEDVRMILYITLRTAPHHLKAGLSGKRALDGDRAAEALADHCLKALSGFDITRRPKGAKPPRTA